MERCPNCGASVRHGAKFCTTCGFRLPEELGEATSSGDAEATVGGVAAETPLAAAAADVGGPQDAVQSGDFGGAERGGTETPGPLGEVLPGWLSASTATWGGGWRPSAEPESEPEAPLAAPEAGTGTTEAGGGAEPIPFPSVRPTQVEVPSIGDAPDDAAAVADEDAAATALADPDVAPAAQAALAEAPPAVVTDGVTARDAPGDLLARVNGMLDELRGLLPALVAAPQAPEPGPDVEAVASELESARHHGDASRAREFEALRSALAAASDRPRDIDTMLDLVGRLDAVIALQEAHDRYAAVIDRAIATLRGEDQNAG